MKKFNITTEGEHVTQLVTEFVTDCPADCQELRDALHDLILDERRYAREEVAAFLARRGLSAAAATVRKHFNVAGD